MGAKVYTDHAIAVALAASGSVKEACRKLGISSTGIESRCRAAKALIRLYERCSLRGSERRGRSSRRTQCKRWAISWKPPASQSPLRIWSVDAVEEDDAKALVDAVMPAFIPRSEFAAVEEIR